MPEFIEKYYTLNELWENLKSLPENRKYLAGGTDNAVALNFGEDSHSCWIDISDIKELREIKNLKNEIFIGSAVRISELEKNSLIKRYFPSIIAAMDYFASPSIRNAATLGGNYANASPCADGVLALAACDADVILNLKGKRRILPVLKPLKGPKKIDLKKDEIVEGFLIRKKELKAVFYKMMSRKMFGISKAGLCMCYKIKNGRFADIKIALSSVAPTIVRAKKTEALLENSYPKDKLNAALSVIKEDISPIDDIRSNADYRRKIVSVYLKRAMESVF